jgi:hypothetical protein
MKTDCTLAHLHPPIQSLATLRAQIGFLSNPCPVVIPEARANHHHRRHQAYKPEHPEGRGDMDRGTGGSGPKGEEVCAEDSLVGLNVRLFI